MAVHTHATYHVDPSNGSSCEEILQTQQTSVRIVAVNSDAVRTGWMLCILSDTIFVELYSWHNAAAPRIATSLSFNSETQISTVP